MTLTHELGHLLGGWAGGGTLRSAWLGPWPPPYSSFQPDPYPALTLWAGPLFGVAAPLLFAALLPARWTKRRRWAWFLADFCLLANSCYLAVSWFTGDRLLDAPRLLAAGVSPVWVGLFCVVACGLGYVRFRADCRAVWEHGAVPDQPSPDDANRPPPDEPETGGGSVV
ncbi:hypothetical protein LzC2_35160 [Planctomycetes bacterium LzC2]|uniref:Uncharacterized protein n=2 Tax=Alienimonas chondri TaxID=2681879 RepID=A0ABX1VGY8_9PLAN|nr:hypothetical protein [Alienimonas chondri]